jgi:hypothetical protein
MGLRHCRFRILSPSRKRRHLTKDQAVWAAGPKRSTTKNQSTLDHMPSASSSSVVQFQPNGRENQPGERFLKLGRALLQSSAWQGLPGLAQALYVNIASKQWANFLFGAECREERLSVPHSDRAPPQGQTARIFKFNCWAIRTAKCDRKRETTNTTH